VQADADIEEQHQLARLIRRVVQIRFGLDLSKPYDPQRAQRRQVRSPAVHQRPTAEIAVRIAQVVSL
jgi:hypothetical protein